MLCCAQVKVQQLASSGLLETALQQLQTSTLSCSLVSLPKLETVPTNSMSHRYHLCIIHVHPLTHCIACLHVHYSDHATCCCCWCQCIAATHS